MAGAGGKVQPATTPLAAPKLRLDKWLCFARFFKSRELASALIEEGHLRLNGQPCAKPAHGVCVGDVLTFVQGGRVRVIRVLALAQRRGPAEAAKLLYLDLDQSTPRVADRA